ncbi:hypothetical protein RhoFasB10_03326 [Rhodococcus sp. B10]|nr:hypothetical protein [Rhodococcus sp. B10]
MAARAAITTRTVINHEDAAIKDLAHELIRRFGTYVRWGDIARYSHEESDAVESVGEPEVRPESDVSATLAETDVSSMSRKQALRFQRDLTDALEEHLDEIEQYDRMLEELEYKRGAAIRRAEELQSRITEVQESISRALR